uniref:uncharacterized protein LOC122778474 isoform X2 n=1 Tax=Solea senegalensis TaxID=28829 RepID=UPI001CD8A086|nr:uncharacterized protein LOC122778474 isoform X2 [Solea senegalensis]
MGVPVGGSRFLANSHFSALRRDVTTVTPSGRKQNKASGVSSRKTVGGLFVCRRINIPVVKEAAMSSRQYLRHLISERLTAAAEEIFSIFEQNIVEYEEEVNRQRKLLEIFCKPRVELRRIELPQIKEEQEEICTSHEGEQLEVKHEADSLMLTPDNEESDHMEPEPDSDQQLLSHGSPVAESPGPTGSDRVDSVSNRNAESETHSDRLRAALMIPFPLNPVESQRQVQLAFRSFEGCFDDPIPSQSSRESKTSATGIQSFHSNMSVKRRRFSLRSSSGTRRGTPVWTKRNQSRSKRNRRKSAPVMWENSLN